MSNAADILIDGKPVGDFLGVVGSFVVVGIAVAIEIPGGIDKGVHGIGLAARGSSAFRTNGVHEFRERRKRRGTFSRESGILREDDRQILIGNRHDAILLTVNNRNRRAPVPLARNAPIAEAV